jgi:hypothetical protein
VSDDPRIPHTNALPNYHNAVIPPDKLKKYALDPRHVARVFGGRNGSDKARVFKAALGFELDNWEILRDRILGELPYHEAVLGDEDEYGQRYNVILPIEGANGKTVAVITAWIIEPDKDYARLISAYVK